MCSSRHRSNVNARTITGKRDAGATSVGQESAKYLGLLMYAVDRFESKVGTWEIPIDKETRFWLPPDPGCGGYSLMHMDAELKSFQERFIFRAPPAGTGPITFRVLVKQGETNKGAFCNTHASSRSYVLLRLHAAPPAPCTTPPHSLATHSSAARVGRLAKHRGHRPLGGFSHALVGRRGWRSGALRVGMRASGRRSAPLAPLGLGTHRAGTRARALLCRA